MVYTKKHPALFFIGIIMLVLWYLGDSGALSGYYEHLAAGKKYKYGGEIATLPFYFGIIAVLYVLVDNGSGNCPDRSGCRDICA